MPEHEEDDTVTFTVKGVDRKARWFFNEISRVHQEEDETLAETRGRIISDLLMEFARYDTGPSFGTYEKRFNNEEDRRKSASGSVDQPQGNNIGIDSEPGF